MNIWRAVHREAMTAWRSMRYDLRRSSNPRTEVIPPVTVDTGQEHPEYEAYTRRTRRLRTAVVVAALSVGGAAATYFGVIGGLTALLADEAGQPGALPEVSAERTPAPPAAADGRASRPDAQAPSMLPPGSPGAPAGSATPVKPGKPGKPGESRPSRQAGPTATRTPPVPTPAPHPTPTCGCPKPTPTPTASPTPSPSPSSPDPSQPPEPPVWAVAPAS